MVSYPLIEKGQWSHKYGSLRVSGATLLHLGTLLKKRVNGAIILKNGLVPPHTSIPLGGLVPPLTIPLSDLQST